MFSETRFSAAASRIGARYETLLDIAQLERLFSASNIADAIRIFREFPFYTGTIEIENPEDFEHLISAALHETRDFLVQFIDNEDFLKILLLPFDLQNAKISFRTFCAGHPYESMQNRRLGSPSFFPYGSAFFFLNKKENLNNGVHKFFTKALTGTIKAHEEFPDDPMYTEDFLNSAFFIEMSRCVKKVNIPAISEYFTRFILVENICRLVRRFPENHDGKIRFFTPEDSKNPTVMLDRSSAIARFLATPLGGFLSEGLSLSGSEERFFWEQRLSLCPLVPIQKEAFVSPLSGEKVARYFFERIVDAKLLRSIFVGKISHQSSGEIRKSVLPLFQLLKK